MTAETTSEQHDWVLAIDYGTTGCAAACGPAPVQVVQFDGNPTVTSAVMLAEDGSFIVGEPARTQAGVAPERLETTPKRRLGAPMVLLGDGPTDPTDLVAATLSMIRDEAVRRHGGREPAAVRLTHPVRWAGRRIEALREAARRAGLGEVELLAEPVAAAFHVAAEFISPGDHVAVFDLGGGTLDIAVLVRTTAGFAVVGSPGGDDALGGETFDDLLYHYLGAQIDDPSTWDNLRHSTQRPWVRANHQFRVGVRQAKEALSTSPDFRLYLPAPADIELRITREEFEHVIRDAVERCVDELVATVEQSGVGIGSLAAVYLVGGSSRIPLVGRVVSDRTGVAATTWGDPKGVVAMGAAGLGAVVSTTRAPLDLVDTPGDVANAGTVVGDDRSAAGSAAGMDQRPGSASSRTWLPGRPATRFGLMAGVVAVVVALALIVTSVLNRSDDLSVSSDPNLSSGRSQPSGEQVGATEPRSLALGSTGLVNGAVAERTWNVVESSDGSGRSFRGEVSVANPTDVATSTFHVEVVHKEIAESASQIEMVDGPDFVVLQDDPVISWELDLEPGATAVLTYVVRDLPAELEDVTLERWAEETAETHQRMYAERAFTFCSVRPCTFDGVPAMSAPTGDPGSGEVLAPGVEGTGADQPGVGGSANTLAQGSSGGSASRPSGGGSGSTGGSLGGNSGGSANVNSGGGGTATTGGSGSASNAGGGSGAVMNPPAVGNPTTPKVDPPSAPQGAVVRDPVSMAGACPVENDSPAVTVTVSWQAPASNGGASITGYVVRIAQKSGNPGNVHVRTVGGGTTATQFTLPAFAHNSHYETTVAAVNSAGQGDAAVAAAVVPNLVGMCTWVAWPVARSVGLRLNAPDVLDSPNGAQSGQIGVQITQAGSQLSAGSEMRAQAFR